MERVWVYENILHPVEEELVNYRMENIQKYATQNQLAIVGKTIATPSVDKDSLQQLKTVIAALQNKTADAVLVYHLMSLGHDLETISKAARKIKDAGGIIISAQEGRMNSPMFDLCFV